MKATTESMSANLRLCLTANGWEFKFGQETVVIPVRRAEQLARHILDLDEPPPGGPAPPK